MQRSKDGASSAVGLTKLGHEAFRVDKFAQPHPQIASQVGAHDLAGSRETSSQEWEEGEGVEEEDLGQPDCSRVILHFDADCFYAQIEELRDPLLRDKPLGITQKYLVVTCNYPARNAGVTKLMNIDDAKKKCPELVLVPGEDLTPYRNQSDEVLRVLREFGSATQKLGMDEVCVDVTVRCKEMVRKCRAAMHPVTVPCGDNKSSSACELRWCGHVHRSQDGVHSTSRYRPMDLRADAGAQSTRLAAFELMSAHAQESARHNAQQGVLCEYTQARRDALAHLSGDSQAGESVGDTGEGGKRTVARMCASDLAAMCESDLLLMAGSMLASEARAAVCERTGVRMSGGIAHNKLLAKLASGLHKPNDQTSLPASEAANFIRPLPVAVLRGAGYKTCRDLRNVGVENIAQLRALSKQRVMSLLGDRVGANLYEAARARDKSAVENTTAPKSITVEDSFKRCTSWQAISLILKVLAPDLLMRLQEDMMVHNRLPSTLTGMHSVRISINFMLQHKHSTGLA